MTIHVSAWPARLPGDVPLEDEHGAEDPEDRARRAGDERRRRLQQRARRAGKAGDEVERDEARRAEVLLDDAADEPEREHVRADVDDRPCRNIDVKSRHQSPWSTNGPKSTHFEERAARPVEPAALHRGEQVDEHVQPDQDLRRPCSRRPARATMRGARERRGSCPRARGSGCRPGPASCIPCRSDGRTPSTRDPSRGRGGDSRSARVRSIATSLAGARPRRLHSR